jgi:hypothetical protein
VISVGDGCDPFSAVVEANANHQRTWLSRMVRRHARLQLSPNLDAGDPLAGLAFTLGGAKLIFRMVSKLARASWHQRMRLSATTRTFSRQDMAASRTRILLASGWECQSRRRTTSHRIFSPYFWVIGGTMPFKRRYSTSCP